MSIITELSPTINGTGIPSETGSILESDFSGAFSEVHIADTLAVSGAYDGTNLTNAPGGSTAWFYIEHLMHSNAVADPGWRLQKAYGLGSPNSGFGAAGTMYIRTMVSNVWQAWRTVTTT